MPLIQIADDTVQVSDKTYELLTDCSCDMPVQVARDIETDTSLDYALDCAQDAVFSNKTQEAFVIIRIVK